MKWGYLLKSREEEMSSFMSGIVNLVIFTVTPQVFKLSSYFGQRSLRVAKIHPFLHHGKFSNLIPET